MDERAKMAGLDEGQWATACERTRVWCGSIRALVLLQTIETNLTYVRVEYEGGRTVVMQMTVGLECVERFPKCEVLSETRFERGDKNVIA